MKQVKVKKKTKPKSQPKTYEKKNFVPRTMIEDVDDDEEEEDVASEFENLTDSEGSDDDDQLRKAFEKGELSTDGLNVQLPFRKRFLVNNETGLKAKLTELQAEQSVPWIERLDLVNGPLEQSEDLTEKYGDLTLKVSTDGVVAGSEREDQAQHDFKREMLFYRQAQAAILSGIPKLKKLGLKTKRPEDYFAQMAKTDDHMKRVQENLNERREQIERSERAKKVRMLKKLGKEVQTQVLQERQKDKRQLLDNVKEFQSGRVDTIDLGDGQVISRNDLPVKQTVGKKKKKPQMNADKKMRVAQKRAHKNTTFGYGGKKKGNKRNDSKSFNAPLFGGGKNKKGGKVRVKPKGGSSAGKNRPGKSRRQNMRGKK